MVEKKRKLGSENIETVRESKGRQRPSHLVPAGRPQAENLADLNEQLRTEVEELRRQVLELHANRDQDEHSIRGAEWLARLAEENPDPVLRVSKHGVVQYRNPASFPLCRQWNPSDELIVPPAIYKIVKAAYAGTKVIRQEMTFGKHTYLITVAAAPARADYVNIFASDITARKQAEEETRLAKERYARLFHVVREGFAHYKAVYDDQGRLVDLLVLEINPAGAQLSGVAPEGQIGRTWRQVWPDVDEKVFALYQKVDETGEPLRFDNDNNLTGRIYDVAVSKAGPGEFITTFNDITDRKQAEEALRESERKLAAELHVTLRLRDLSARMIGGGDLQELYEQMLDTAVAIMDSDFASIQMLQGNGGARGNGNVLQLLAWRGFHPQSARFWETVRLDSTTSCGAALRCGTRCLVADVEAYDLFAGTPDLEEYRRSGIRSMQSTPLMSRSGRLLGMISTHWRQPHEPPAGALHLFDVLARQVADLIERKHDEESLRELNATLESKVAQRTAELEHRTRQLQKLTLDMSEAEDRERQRLAEILHDDLQQIIAAAKFQLSVMRSRIKQDASLHALSLEIDHLLKEAIEKSRGLSHELSPAVLHHGDFTETLDWLANQTRAKYGLVVHVHAPDKVDLPSDTITALLYRTAQELLFNVVKHARVNEANLRVRRRGPCVCLAISDRGRGFDPQRLGEAVGFGLLSIRERIELLGGRMKIRSAKGKGSTFFLAVPDSPEPGDRLQKPDDGKKADESLPPSVLRHPSSVLRVLLADDHKIVREGLRSLLSEEPDVQIVGEAAHGREAVDLALRLEPDVVIMDVSMPLIDGDAATRQIKEHQPKTRVIALSTYNEPEMIERMYRAGAEGYVLKTASSDELLAAIRGRRQAPSVIPSGSTL